MTKCSFCNIEFHSWTSPHLDKVWGYEYCSEICFLQNEGAKQVLSLLTGLNKEDRDMFISIIKEVDKDNIMECIQIYNKYITSLVC